VVGVCPPTPAVEWGGWDCCRGWEHQVLKGHLGEQGHRLVQGHQVAETCPDLAWTRFGVFSLALALVLGGLVRQVGALVGSVPDALALVLLQQKSLQVLDLGPTVWLAGGDD